MASAVRLLHPARAGSQVQVSSSLAVPRIVVFNFNKRQNSKRYIRHSSEFSGPHKSTPVVQSSQQNDGVVPSDNEDGVSLGTLKLPGNTDLQRFESLLFQVCDNNLFFLKKFIIHIMNIKWKNNSISRSPNTWKIPLTTRSLVLNSKVRVPGKFLLRMWRPPSGQKTMLRIDK